MKIYTKTGDKGMTSLVGGSRVMKSDTRVEAYGDVDELLSCLGLLLCDTPSESASLRRIQVSLMNASAVLACPDAATRLKPFDFDREILFLESEIDRMTKSMPAQTAFILPGEPRASSLCHVARCVCRRAERHSVAIPDRTAIDDSAIRFLNRLSDFLFTLARFLCHAAGRSDCNWIP